MSWEKWTLIAILGFSLYSTIHESATRKTVTPKEATVSALSVLLIVLMITLVRYA